MADLKEYEIKCTACQAELVFDETMDGQTHPCPECGVDLTLSIASARELTATEPAAPAADPEPSPPAPAAEPPPPEPAGPAAPVAEPPPAMTPPGGAAFPERMKANKVIAGKVCGHCGKAITLGEDVFNCQKCQASMHLACHEKSGHCANPQCEDAAPARLAQAAPMPLAGAAGAPAIQPLPGHAPLTLRKPAGPAASAGGPPPASAAAVAASGGKGYLPVGMKECRFCGETIRQNARKCRFCGEYQLDIDRTSKSVQFEDPDDKLQVGWIIFALLPCGWICCIIGLIWGIMGKKKGWKLLAIAFIAQIVWGVISMIFGETGGGYGGY